MAVLLELCAAVDDATLAGLAEGADAPLAAWLTAPAGDATPEALLLALRLWPRLPPGTAAACPLLPAGVKPKQLPRALWSDPAAAGGSKAVAGAAAAFFTRPHLEGLLPVLRATTAAHPRLHSVWPTLVALLIPGFSADKARAGPMDRGWGRALLLHGMAQTKAPCSRWPCRLLVGSSGPLKHASTPALRAPSPPLPQERRDAGARGAHPAAAPLAAFWSCCVDGDLVASSHERKYLALQLFQLLLPHLGCVAGLHGDAPRAGRAGGRGACGAAEHASPAVDIRLTSAPFCTPRPPLLCPQPRPGAPGLHPRLPALPGHQPQKGGQPPARQRQEGGGAHRRLLRPRGGAGCVAGVAGRGCQLPGRVHVCTCLP